MKKKITLKYYGHRYPEQLLMRAANMISAVTPTDRLTIHTSTKSATIYADPIQARAIAKQVKKSTGVTVIVNLPDNVGRFIDFLVAEGVFAEYVRRHRGQMFRWFDACPPEDWIICSSSWRNNPAGLWRSLHVKWQNILTTNQ